MESSGPVIISLAFKAQATTRPYPTPLKDSQAAH